MKCATHVKWFENHEMTRFARHEMRRAHEKNEDRVWNVLRTWNDLKIMKWRKAVMKWCLRHRSTKFALWYLWAAIRKLRLISCLPSKHFIRLSVFHLTDLSGKFHCSCRSGKSYLLASSMATATATVIPTMGLLPAPDNRRRASLQACLHASLWRLLHERWAKRNKVHSTKHQA